MGDVLDNIAERCEIIIFTLTVNTIVYRDKANIKFRESNFSIHSDFQIVAPQTGHIFDHDHTDKTIFNISQHFLKAGTVEIGAGIAVIFVDLIVGDIVVLDVLGQDRDLMCNTIAVTLIVVIAGKADIKRHPFFQ